MGSTSDRLRATPQRARSRAVHPELPADQVKELRLPAAAPAPPLRQSLEPAAFQAAVTPPKASWSPRNIVIAALGLGLSVGLLALLWPKITVHTQGPTRVVAVMLAKPAVPEQAAPTEEVAEAAAPEAAAPAAAAPAEVRADASLDRRWRSPIAGGVLTLPPSFASADGAYDLVVHFHGNTELVEESFSATKLNAVVVVMNLGVGSGVYEDRFANVGMLPEILERTRTTLEKRGLREPHLRRLALTAWSAGYGAIARILEQPAMVEKVDAVVLFDGLHCGFLPGTQKLRPERLAPFERFAKQAALGQKLFSIAHSNITPYGDYASARATADGLLKSVGATRSPGGVEPKLPSLASMDGVLPKQSIHPLKPSTEAHQGGLHVRGYLGDRPEHHIMHLVQMSETALPDLVHHWN